MSFINTPPQISIPITGSAETFPVHQIYCVGRNYQKHISEMGYSQEKTVPFVLFLKPPDAVVQNGQTVCIPGFTNDFQHEVELVIAIKKEGSKISEKLALEHVYGYSVGIDLTCRDLQNEAKNKGRPWTFAKSLQNSAPISDITPVEKCGYLQESNIQLSVNGNIRQKNDLKNMIRPVQKIISELSQFYTLFPGDIIFTGTPDGVGKLEKGDRIFAEIDGLEPLTITIN